MIKTFSIEIDVIYLEVVLVKSIMHNTYDVVFYFLGKEEVWVCWNLAKVHPKLAGVLQVNFYF